MKQVVRRRARNLLLRLADMLNRGIEPPFRSMLQGIKAASIIGKHCVVTPPIESFIWRERAERMRSNKAQTKAQTPKEIALQAAIKAEYEAMAKNGMPVDLTHRYATAETLLDGVNRRLAAAAKAGNFEFKPIKRKSLGDRLKKLRPDSGIDGWPQARGAHAGAEESSRCKAAARQKVTKWRSGFFVLEERN
jgi:hypothetical protein